MYVFHSMNITNNINSPNPALLRVCLNSQGNSKCQVMDLRRRKREREDGGEGEREREGRGRREREIGHVMLCACRDGQNLVE